MYSRQVHGRRNFEAGIVHDFERPLVKVAPCHKNFSFRTLSYESLQLHMMLHGNPIFTDIHKIQRLELSFPVADVILLKAYCRNMTYLQYSILNYKDEKESVL